MKALEELTKEELISFIYNYPPGDINIFDRVAGCFCCGESPKFKYWYQCQDCQDMENKNGGSEDEISNCD